MAELRLEFMPLALPRFVMPRRSRVMMSRAGFAPAAPVWMMAEAAVWTVAPVLSMPDQVVRAARSMTASKMSAAPTRMMAEAAVRAVAPVPSMLDEVVRAARSVTAAKMSAVPARLMAEAAKRAVALVSSMSDEVVRAVRSVTAAKMSAAMHRVGVHRTAMSGVAAAPIVPARANLEPHVSRPAPRRTAMRLTLAAARAMIAICIGRSAPLVAAVFRLAMLLASLIVGDEPERRAPRSAEPAAAKPAMAEAGAAKATPAGAWAAETGPAETASAEVRPAKARFARPVAIVFVVVSVGVSIAVAVARRALVVVPRVFAVARAFRPPRAEAIASRAAPTRKTERGSSAFGRARLLAAIAVFRSFGLFGRSPRARQQERRGR